MNADESTSMRMAAVRTIVGVVALAPFILAGCAREQDDASGACVSAFRDATPRAGAPYNASPLDDAIKRCRTVAAWNDAWNRVPGAHPPSRQAREYLEERCGAETLRTTGLCQDLTNGAPAT